MEKLTEQEIKHLVETCQNETTKLPKRRIWTKEELIEKINYFYDLAKNEKLGTEQRQRYLASFNNYIAKLKIVLNKKKK